MTDPPLPRWYGLVLFLELTLLLGALFFMQGTGMIP